MLLLERRKRLRRLRPPFGMIRQRSGKVHVLGIGIGLVHGERRCYGHIYISNSGERAQKRASEVAAEPMNIINPLVWAWSLLISRYMSQK